MASTHKHRHAGCGSVTAEFSLILVAFLMLVCGILEVARIIYLFNTLQVVTLRAATQAAQRNFRDAADMDAVRRHAVFRDTPGVLPLGAPVSDSHVRIEYLALAGSAGAMMTVIAPSALPSCPVSNKLNCMKDPYGPSCIRLVQARICDPAYADSCHGVPYQGLFSFIRIPLTLPMATAIVPAEALGVRPGDPACP